MRQRVGALKTIVQTVVLEAIVVVSYPWLKPEEIFAADQQAEECTRTRREAFRQLIHR